MRHKRDAKYRIKTGMTFTGRRGGASITGWADDIKGALTQLADALAILAPDEYVAGDEIWVRMFTKGWHPLMPRKRRTWVPRHKLFANASLVVNAYEIMKIGSDRPAAVKEAVHIELRNLLACDVAVRHRVMHGGTNKNKNNPESSMGMETATPSVPRTSCMYRTKPRGGSLQGEGAQAIDIIGSMTGPITWGPIVHDCIGSVYVSPKTLKATLNSFDLSVNELDYSSIALWVDGVMRDKFTVPTSTLVANELAKSMSRSVVEDHDKLWRSWLESCVKMSKTQVGNNDCMPNYSVTYKPDDKKDPNVKPD